jgi:putative transposase
MPKEAIRFQGFDELGQVRIYSHAMLPHWRQTGCTYFVTFRLADSIPENVLAELEYERRLWLRHRDINADAADWKQLFFKLPSTERRTYEKLVGCLLNRALDSCHGSSCLRNPAIGNSMATALDYFHGERVLTGDFVVMPNHVHVLLTPMEGHELEDILHSIKSYTAKQINRSLSQTGAFWHRDSYDHIVRDAEQLIAYQEYTAANPIKAKLRQG